jgi:hypothetical protein
MTSSIMKEGSGLPDIATTAASLVQRGHRLDRPAKAGDSGATSTRR